MEKPYDMEEEQKFKGYLESIGDCVVVVSDDDIVKVHVHTNDPGLAFEKGSDLRFPFQHEDRQYARGAPGALIQNASNAAQTRMARQARRSCGSQRAEKAYGFIAVSIGDGLARSLRGLVLII